MEVKEGGEPITTNAVPTLLLQHQMPLWETVQHLFRIGKRSAAQQSAVTLFNLLHAGVLLDKK